MTSSRGVEPMIGRQRPGKSNWPSLPPILRCTTNAAATTTTDTMRNARRSCMSGAAREALRRAKDRSDAGPRSPPLYVAVVPPDVQGPERTRRHLLALGAAEPRSEDHTPE